MPSSLQQQTSNTEDFELVSQVTKAPRATTEPHPENDTEPAWSKMEIKDPVTTQPERGSGVWRFRKKKTQKVRCPNMDPSARNSRHNPVSPRMELWMPESSACTACSASIPQRKAFHVVDKHMRTVPSIPASSSLPRPAAWTDTTD